MYYVFMFILTQKKKKKKKYDLITSEFYYNFISTRGDREKLN